jgi:hypothetical protein
MKSRYSFNLDTSTMDLIDNAAKQNQCTRSAIATMFLQLISFVPIEKLKHTSPLPDLLGINTETYHAGK